MARADGKVIFINGALPGELVTYNTYRRMPAYELAEVHEVREPAAARTVPRCRYFGMCGGCSMQHIDARAQVAAKQRVLEDSLAHIGKVPVGQILQAIYGEPWGYRQRARFSVRYVPKKGGALIGFREKRSSHVADMATCEVVPGRISALLMPLRELINELSIPDRVPQIELAIGGDMVVLVLRILAPLGPDDEQRVREFADRYHVHFFLQPRGPDTAVPFYPGHGGVLHYSLPEFALDIGFSPTEFTQVNHAVNAVLVRRAIALLDPRPGEQIGDMFCGLGNFTLAIARSGASVVGVEGSGSLVARAQANAELNELGSRARFLQRDLFKLDRSNLAQLGSFDRMLIDPPRDGAVQLIKALPDRAPQRIVYVSCNAATLARDAGILVHTQGYVLSAAGIVNMFPHTSHVESIAVFDKLP